MRPATRAAARPTIVLDVLGTLVDQTGSMERRVSARAGADSGTAAEWPADGWAGMRSFSSR